MWSAATLAAQQPAITASEIDQIKKDVTAAVEKYYRLFSEQNIKALPAEVFNIPWIQMTGNGPQSNLTQEQSLAGFETSEARKFFGAPMPLSSALERDYLTPWPAATAEKRFRERFESLVKP